MDTIKTYLDNLFNAQPQTANNTRLKNELLMTMEDKYRELKSAGKTENEAIGIVISEFGNIDELMNEITPENTRTNANSADIKPRRRVSLTEAKTFIELSKNSGTGTGLGVFVILTGVAGLLFSLSSEINLFNVLGFVFLFIAVAVGVITIILKNIRLEEYEYLDSEFFLENGAADEIRREQKIFQPGAWLRLAAGIVCCILAALWVIVPALMETGEHPILFFAAFLLLTVGIGVFLIIGAGVPMDAYDKLLQQKDYAPVKKRNEKIIGAIASVFWPLVVAAYLISSFMLDSWDISWIIWPVAGLIFGAVAGGISSYNSGKE